MSRSRSDITQDIQRGGQAGSMSRSAALGVSDPRNRRGSQAEQLTEQRFNREQFTVNDDAQIELRLKTPNDTRIVEVEFINRWDAALGTNPTVFQNNFLQGCVFLLSSSDTIEGLSFWIPEDLDRTRDATLHVRWYVRGASTGTGTTCSWDIPVLAYVLGSAANSTATDTLQVVDGALPDPTEEAGAELVLNATTLFAPTVSALKFQISRVASSGDPTDSDAEAPALHMLAVEYHVKHDHQHKR